MAVADDLLRLADHLLQSGSANAEQIWYRKSVSTAYYALFHLLVESAANRWQGSPDLQVELQRAFEHRRMRDVSSMASSGSWRGWGDRTLPPQELRDTAKIFVALQEARHSADYDNSVIWNSLDVTAYLQDARTAFQNWRSIQNHPAANEYLLALLVGKKRE